MQDTDWKRAGRAVRLGAMCGLGPSLILFGWYFLQHRHLPMPFARIGVTSAAIGSVTGAALGGSVSLLVARFDRARGWWRLLANPITAGLVGGALSSIAAGVFAIAVFGSYRGPYVGTVESVALLVTACWSLATLLAVDAARGSRAGTVADLVPATGCVILAAVATAAVTLGATIAVAPSVISEGVFWTARHAIAAHGAVTVGCVLGVTVGAMFGAHLGLTILLARRRR